MTPSYLLIFIPLLVNSASVGDPKEAICKNLKPQETTSYFARGKGPYSLKLTPFVKEGYIELVLEAKDGNTFEGFMVQARNGSAPGAIGKFAQTPNVAFTDCFNSPRSSASEADKSKKTSVTLKWEIPAGLPKESTILFKATVTKQFLEYNKVEEAIKI